MSNEERAKRFEEIMKEYGIKYYWCHPKFDAGAKRPVGNLVVPKDNASLMCEVMDLYNEGVDNDEDLFFVNTEDLSLLPKDVISYLIKNKEKRYVK